MSSPRRLQPRYFALAAIFLVAVLIGRAPSDEPVLRGRLDGQTASGDQLFDAKHTAPAASKRDLVLFVDGQSIVGWISGEAPLPTTASHVTVDDGREKTRIPLERDRTFRWNYDIDRPTTATVTWGEISRSERLAPPAPTESACLFVVDRPVYRPGQTLRFTGFLRREAHGGGFEPCADREVEVRIATPGGKNVAARLKLVADSQGRIDGEYRFIDADALSDYELQIDGVRGKAVVKLAEFRKAKVRVKIDAELDDRDLELTIRGVDFLDKPVPATSIRFTAQVLRDGGSGRERPLDGRAFAFAQQTSLERVFGDDHLSEDDRLLRTVGMLPPWGGRAAGTQVVSQLQGALTVDADGKATHRLKLERAWTRGPYSIAVQAVLVDRNRREQRASRVIGIGTRTRNCELALEMAKDRLVTGEDVGVSLSVKDAKGDAIAAQTTLVALQLTPERTAFVDEAIYGNYRSYRNFNNNNWRGSRHSYRGKIRRLQRLRWIGAANPGGVRRTMVTAWPVVAGRATVRLEQAGAYKLVAICRLGDGRVLRKEIGCVVREPERLPPLVLDLDDRSLTAGDTLRGTIHSRARDAAVLLTLRDSTGLRWWRAMRLKGSSLRFSQPLPLGLTYGCRLELHAIDAEGQRQTITRTLRVVPSDRMLKVVAKAKPRYAPGEAVELDVQVDREEAVDLVVAVYDQSLLGVARDRSVSPTDFFLADERGREGDGLAAFRRQLAGLTLDDLAGRARQRMKRIDKKERRNAPYQHLSRFVAQTDAMKKGRGYLDATALLLALAPLDLPIDLDQQLYAHFGHGAYIRMRPDGKRREVLELLGTLHRGFQVCARLVDGRILVAFVQPGALLRPSGSVIMRRGYGSRGARGDAFHSVSGNAMHSNVSNGGFGGGAVPITPISAEAHTLGELDELSGVRRNFSDAACWKTRLRTDSRGRATVRFTLPDSLTNWQVVVTAVSRKMHVGRGTARFKTYKPLMVWPMIPRSFTEGDRVRLYASVHNRTDRAQRVQVELRAENGRVVGDAKQTVDVAAKSQRPVYWTFVPGAAGYTQLLMSARGPAGSDASLKRLPVARCAAWNQVTASGAIDGGFSIDVPADCSLDEAELELTLVPSQLEDLRGSLDYLVQYPYGCVEQTMSRFLPALRVAQAMDKAEIADEGLRKKLPGVVSAGVKRLLQLQRPDGGWGWQRSSQTHEMMTPYALYGLLQAERAGHRIPDEKAIERGLERLNTFIGRMGHGQTADRLYCMYVYAHRHQPSSAWWRFIEKGLERKQLSDYALALALEMAARHDQPALARRLVTELGRSARGEKDAAYWTTANFSRWGNDRFEITGAALKAIVAHDPKHPLIPRVLTYLNATKCGDRWNSTKATAMIIFALCDYLATQEYRPGDDRDFVVSINGHRGQKVSMNAARRTVVKVSGRDLVRGERNRIRFSRPVAGGVYRAVLRYWKHGKTVRARGAGMTVSRRFYLLDAKGQQVREVEPGDEIKRGSYLRCIVSVRRAGGEQMSYVLVTSPRPATCEILPVTDKRFAQPATHYALREDRVAGVAWHHEQTGAQISDSCVLHAELAGSFLVPPAEVEMMYRTEVHGSSAAFHFTVVD